MQMFDFFSRDEMRSAPADPEEAFLYLVELAYKRLSDRSEKFDFDNGWHEINEARLGFINVVVGFAKAYRVEPIASMIVPAEKNYGDADYRQFRTDLDHYLVQLLGRQVQEEREDSIALIPTTKEKLRTYLHHIKVCIDKVTVSDAKRATLHAKLAEFEAALENNRLSLAKVMKFIMGLGLTGLTLADSQTFNKLLNGLVETVNQVHAIEEEQRKLPPAQPAAMLIPARPAEPKGTKQSFDLDDEIPF